MSEPIIVDEKELEKVVERKYLDIQKRDFRATVVHRDEKGAVPSDVATFMHIDEGKKDDLDNPVELDTKGTISEFESYHFKDVNYAMALASLKSWCFFDVEEKDRDGNTIIVRTPVNLAQIDMLSKKRLNMSLWGQQSEKHIRALHANSGQYENILQKTARFMGWGQKSELKQQYGIQK